MRWLGFVLIVGPAFAKLFHGFDRGFYFDQNLFRDLIFLDDSARHEARQQCGGMEPILLPQVAGDAIVMLVNQLIQFETTELPPVWQSLSTSRAHCSGR